MRLPSVVRWGVKSAGGLAANLLLLTLWVDGAGLPPELAVGINWVLIALVGYAVTDRWVFDSVASPDSLSGHLRQFLGMQGVMGSSKIVNYAIYVGLIQLGIDYRVSWATGAVVVFLVTYGANKRLWESEIAQRA